MIKVLLNYVRPRLYRYFLYVKFRPHEKPGQQGCFEWVNLYQTAYGSDDFFDGALGLDPGKDTFDEGGLYFLIIVVGGAHAELLFAFEIYHVIITLISLSNYIFPRFYRHSYSNLYFYYILYCILPTILSSLIF